MYPMMGMEPTNIANVLSKAHKFRPHLGVVNDLPKTAVLPFTAVPVRFILQL